MAPGRRLGHPPFDGRQFNGEAPGGIGVPHADIHFWTISDAERMELVGYGSCVTIPHAANTPTGEPEVCNQQAATTDAATAKYYTFPPPEYTTGFEEITIFGGAAVVGHGNHMATVEDNAGPGTCTLVPAARRCRPAVARLHAAVPRRRDGRGAGPTTTARAGRRRCPRR